MSEQDFEEKINLFWEECDSWVADRIKSVSTLGTISADDIVEIEAQIEEDINTLFEKSIEFHGESFSPQIMIDLHHLFFEMEFKRRGIKNEEHIHKYKDNGLVGLAVAQGKIKPDHSLLIMEVNRAHHHKKGDKEEGVCEDCICGKKNGK